MNTIAPHAAVVHSPTREIRINGKTLTRILSGVRRRAYRAALRGTWPTNIHARVHVAVRHAFLHAKGWRSPCSEPTNEELAQHIVNAMASFAPRSAPCPVTLGNVRAALINVRRDLLGDDRETKGRQARRVHGLVLSLWTVAS